MILKTAARKFTSEPFAVSAAFPSNRFKSGNLIQEQEQAI